MLNHGLSHRKRMIRLPALGLLILGLMCIAWALTNIIQQTVLVKDTMRSITSEVSVNPLKISLQLSQDIHSPLNQKGLDSSTPDSAIYPTGFSEGDVIGSLMIPVLDLTLPIVEGTEVDTLKKGVGHFSQSVLPGIDDNCVLSGHRDTVFPKLGEVVIGDLLIIKTEAGTFTYKVSNLRIVENNDRTIIVPTDHAVLTLTTCYPFQFIGNAPQRYIVEADLLSDE